MENIIFVCAGNSCRSPMAKYIMRHLTEKFQIDSAGCHTRGGGRLSKGAVRVLKENKIPFDQHVSQRFTKDLYEKFTHVIALDEDIFHDAIEISGGDPAKKIRMFNIEDPMITGDYLRAYKEIYRACELLLSELTTQKNFVKDFESVRPSLNDSPYKRILAIGDVHGSMSRLKNLWEKLQVTDDDRVIFLGDYVDGFEGFDTDIETLHWLMDANKNKNVKILRGNVDDDWANLVLDSNSEECKFIKSMPCYHREFVGGREIIFCHGGFDADKPLEYQSKSRFLTGGNFYRDYEGDALVVVGHKSPTRVYKRFPKLFPAPVDNKKPMKIPNKNILLMDTRAKDISGGFISAVDVLTGEFWQSEDVTDVETTHQVAE